MRTSRPIVAAVLAALALAPAPGAAQDLSDLAGLLNEPVVSTASKSAETAGLAPATTSVLTSDDLRRHGITSLDEAINFLGLGLLTEPAYGTVEIGARGVLLSGDYGTHVLLLVDGHALNEQWNSTAYYDRNAAIPFDLVDHIEVILGPGSVLYGSNAMLGVINVITKRARDYAGVHLVAEGGVPATGHASIGFGKQVEAFGHTFELTGAIDGYGTRPPLEYGLQPFDGGTWGGDASHGEVAVPSAHLRLVVGDLDIGLRSGLAKRTADHIYGTTFDDPENWERDRWLSLDAKWSRSVGRKLGLSARVYGDLYEYFFVSPFATADDCLEGQATCTMRNLGSSRWAGAEASATVDWREDGRFVTLVGAEVRRSWVHSWLDFRDGDTGEDTRIASYAPAGTTVGAYLQQTLHPARWLSLNAGARLDADPDLGSHLSPRVAAVVPAWRGGTLKAIYSEAFRAPSFFERAYSDTSWIASPDLDPETVRSLEGVVEQRVGALRLRASGFRTGWQDLVLLADATPGQVAAAIARGELAAGTTDAYVYENASRVNSYGLNADLDGSALGQRLRYGAGVTVARSRREGDGDGGSERLAAAAEVFGNARVSWVPGGRRPFLSLAARFVGPRPVSHTDFDPTPEAGAQVELRAALGGSLGGGLGYQLAGSWSSDGKTAYAVGPAREALPGYDEQALLPRARFQLMAGLRFDR